MHLHHLKPAEVTGHFILTALTYTVTVPWNDRSMQQKSLCDLCSPCHRLTAHKWKDSQGSSRAAPYRRLHPLRKNQAACRYVYFKQRCEGAFQTAACTKHSRREEEGGGGGEGGGGDGWFKTSQDSSAKLNAACLFYAKAWHLHKIKQRVFILQNLQRENE